MCIYAIRFTGLYCSQGCFIRFGQISLILRDLYNPQSLSIAPYIALLGTLEPRAFRLSNYLDPLLCAFMGLTIPQEQFKPI